MSANQQNETTNAAASQLVRTIRYPELDEHCWIEAGLRIPELRRGNEVNVAGKAVSNPGAFAPKRPELPGHQTQWAASKTRPQGAKMRRIEVPMTVDGFVPIPEKDDQGKPVRTIFDQDGGSLMLKIVSAQPNGYFVVPVRKRPPQREAGDKGQNWHPVYTYDPTNNYPGKLKGQRENGDFVYSIPIEGILPKKEELDTKDIIHGRKHTKYFFIFRFLADPNYKPTQFVKMEVDKIVVQRGDNHFRVMVENYWQHPGKLSVNIARIQQLLDGEPDLQELPTLEAVRLYLENLKRHTTA